MSSLDHHFVRQVAGRALFVWLMIAVSGSASASAWEIVPHRAIYSLDLASNASGSTVADVDGQMMFQWTDSCDGWTVEQRYRMNFLYVEGQEVEIASTYATWESKDGAEFSFNVRNTTNGVVDKEVRGTATLGGQGGTASFRMPEEVTHDLPPGTIFPTAHTLKMLNEAEAEDGRRFFTAFLFDGTDFDSISEISAVIGSPQGSTDKAGEKFEMLDRPSWPIRLAFFPMTSTVPEPDYEMGVRLFDNGIVDDLLIDYGDFALRATLDQLEPVEPSDCE